MVIYSRGSVMESKKLPISNDIFFLSICFEVSDEKKNKHFLILLNRAHKKISSGKMNNDCKTVIHEQDNNRKSTENQSKVTTYKAFPHFFNSFRFTNCDHPVISLSTNIFEQFNLFSF